MKLIGNILWFILTGLVTGIEYVFLGIGWCISIIGIPFGIQCFKLAKLSFWPFGRKIEKKKKHPVANVIWFILGGFTVVLTYLVIGIFWCITIVGLPFGKQCFKLAKLSLAPFGKETHK